MRTFKIGDTFYYYEIVGVLGAGLHGGVFAIRHRQTGDVFALKTMHAADCVDPNKTARALVAAKGNYAIEHRNVLQVHDLNCESDGLVWMRTELLKGYTIDELLTRQGRLSLPFALAVCIEAAFGLHAIHEAQTIHRDVKPSNLFYTVGRTVKVIDLSLAKVFPEGLETTVGRRVGLGTPAFGAPEQFDGHVSPDVRFDVYSLGITLWMMLVGRNPFADVLHNVPELIKRQITMMPPLLADVARLPPRVDEVVRRAIAKDPAARYGSMMEMARAMMDLNAWIAAEARARRLILDVPDGEPPLPGDTNTWRDYQPAEPVATHQVPAPIPRDRVVVATPVPLAREPLPVQGARGLAATVPMDPTARLAQTLPFDRPSPAAPVALVSSQARTADRGSSQQPSPDATTTRATPLGTAPGAVVAPHPARPISMATTSSRLVKPTPSSRRTPWTAVVVSIVVASVTSVALVVSFRGGRAAADAAAPTQLPSVATPSVTAPVVEPPPPLTVEPPNAPSAAASSAVASATATPAGVPTASASSSAGALRPPAPTTPRGASVPAKYPPLPAALPMPYPVPPAPPEPTHRAPFRVEP